jgi:hypothetical protein
LTVDTEKIVPPKPRVETKPLKPVEQKSKWQLFLIKYKLYLAIGGAVLLALLILFLLLRKKEEPVIEEEETPTIVSPVPARQEEQTKVVSVQEEPLAFFESFDGKQYPVYKIPAMIGKSNSNDVVIPGEYISRKHAILIHKNGYFYIADNNSSNGLFVDGRKIKTETMIENGSRVGFGPYETVFKVVVAGEAPAAAHRPSEDQEKTRLNR